jgi:6-phospho-beta-glucosidase
VKVAVIGGGSTYTPELADGFARRQRQARLAVDELALQDLDPERLEVVGGLARRILARQGWPGRLTLTTDLEEAAAGADVAIIQLRVGGQAARQRDETIPLRFGCIGQETTGPGGFAKALRTVPVVLELADRIATVAAPGAWIIDFTNPVGIVTRALLDAGHRAIGLCNVAIGFQRTIAALCQVEPERVELEHVGLNHLSWVRAAYLDGADRLPALLARPDAAQVLAGQAEQPVELLRALGAVPSYYLRFYYLRDQVLAEQRAAPSRAERVAAIERELLEAYRDPALDTKPALLEQRGGAFYSEAAAQLVESLVSGRGDVQVVNLRNGTTVAGLPPEAVVEVPARIDRDGAHPLPQAPLAPELLGLVQQVSAYERLTVEAARRGDRGVALRALLANPLVAQYPVAVPLLEALLQANRAQLPRFFLDHPQAAPHQTGKGA